MSRAAHVPSRPGGVAVDADRRRRLKVCLVAHLAFGSLSGRPGHIGGVEYQTSLLARWLAARGHDVSMITWDEGQEEGSRIDGVRLVKLCGRDDGHRGLRFLHPRWTSLVRALRVADADLYYHNCAEYVTGQVALWCRTRGSRFVFSAASNNDCDPGLPFLTTARERVLYRLGIRLADRIIVQTDLQRRMLREGFGLDSTVIPLPTPDGPAAPPYGPRSGRTRILWVGRICEIKRPDRFLDMAARCAGLAFDLVGPEDGTPYARAVTARARTLANVRLHGALPRDRVAALLGEAVCLCCTSELEGFPNTFLEAWSHATPVLTTFDPGDIVSRERLGLVVDPEQLAGRLLWLLRNDVEWSRLSTNARRYCREHHAVDRVMPRFESVFADLLGSRS